MRKITFLMLLFLVTFTVVHAQDISTETTEPKANGSPDLISKRGFTILPEAGDIGLGVDAIPFVNYFGNFMNATSNNTGAFNFVDGTNTIVGKYMLTESSDIRFKFRVGKGRTKDVEYIMKDTMPVPDPNVTVEDIEYNSYSNYTIGAGYEMSRGHGRIQGYFGGEVLFQYTSSNLKYEYGNGYSPDFTNPYTTDFGFNKTTTGRLLEVNGINTMGFGLRGFIGIEYFFAPKLSIGGEFGWGVGCGKTFDADVIEEQWDGLQIQEEKTKLGGGSNWMLDTDNAGGGVFLTFYF